MRPKPIKPFIHAGLINWYQLFGWELKIRVSDSRADAEKCARYKLMYFNCFSLFLQQCPQFEPARYFQHLLAYSRPFLMQRHQKQRERLTSI
jgi:hypothetical protein